MTLVELKKFYQKNRNNYSQDKQNKVDYLFRVLESSFGDVAHIHEIEELLKEPQLTIFDVLANFNEWKPAKNKYFASKL